MILQTMSEKGKALCIFFNMYGRSFLIACYILYPGYYLKNNGNHQAGQKISLFKQQGTLFSITGCFKPFITQYCKMVRHNLTFYFAMS